MAKRMTSTEKWDDPFFYELKPEYKLFWIYLLDKCNHAGIIDINLKMATFCTGYEYEINEILNTFKDRIEVLKSGKWFIKKFVEFQYGELQNSNNTHKSVISLLKKEGVFKPLMSPLQGDQDTDKDKDKDIDKDNAKNLYSLEHCSYVALMDKTWADDSGANKENLSVFCSYLKGTGENTKHISDFKKHFFNWKRKDPKELQSQVTTILNFDKYNKK